ncbi:hypothetical protein LC612_29250 [Nostoc sp. CHAB 5834]|nr:hypothetical protein [Nostoc sp. CHAB 5834]
MSNTHNTSISRQRTKLRRMASQVIRTRGTAAAQPLLNAMDALKPIVRIGNSRKAFSDLKVVQRRLARRAANREFILQE